jgi:hypothetical protein
MQIFNCTIYTPQGFHFKFFPDEAGALDFAKGFLMALCEDTLNPENVQLRKEHYGDEVNNSAINFVNLIEGYIATDRIKGAIEILNNSEFQECVFMRPYNVSFVPERIFVAMWATGIRINCMEVFTDRKSAEDHIAEILARTAETCISKPEILPSEEANRMIATMHMVKAKLNSGDVPGAMDVVNKTPYSDKFDIWEQEL